MLLTPSLIKKMVLYYLYFYNYLYCNPLQVRVILLELPWGPVLSLWKVEISENIVIPVYEGNKQDNKIPVKPLTAHDPVIFVFVCLLVCLTVFIVFTAELLWGPTLSLWII